jgi:hypothetical protein
MLKKLTHLWNTRFAPRDWTTFKDAKGRTFRARRWVNGAWEYRDLSPEEIHVAGLDWSIR